MKRFTLTAAGLTAAALCGAANADISVVFDTNLGPGQFISISLGSMSGTLTGICADIFFTNNAGDGSWASDMLVMVSDGTTGFSAGGFNLSFGLNYIGSWDSGASSSSNFYSMQALGGGAMAGNGVLYIANGWNAGGGAGYDGKITLKGLNYVPAPGALALVGLAGLTRSRRRAR